MEYLRAMKGLRKLSLQGADITDASIGILAGFRELRELNLYRTRITNAGLAQLRELPQLAVLAVFGAHVGRAFALRDDLLGIWGDPEVTGKPAGDDLAEGKATVILALATEIVEGDDADLLRHPERDVPAAVRVLERAGIDARVEELICDDVRLARDVLARAPLDTDGLSGLLALAATIAWRQA